jgi:hypothetical protein
MKVGVMAVHVVIGGLLLAGCAGNARDYKSFVREQPPCALAPLTDAQIMAVARRELGKSFFSVSGMPERPHRITARGCVYEVEYPILSNGSEWFGFDAVDGTSSILIARVLSTFAFGAMAR